jgi:hypothetical protein
MIKPLWLVRVALLWAVVGSTVGQAQQTGFESRTRGGWAEFGFAWQDGTGRAQRLQFALPLDDVRRGADEFAAVNKTDEQAFVLARMQDYARQHSAGRTSVSVTREGEGYLIATEGPDEAVLQQHAAALKEVQKQAQRDYLQRQFYQPTGTANTYMPDYPTLAARYAPALAPVGAAIRAQTQGLPMREVVNFTLNFLQSIPYDTLQDSRTSNGAGFQTPHGLLARNMGDCDTKSVALAALLRGIFPELPLMMVYVEQHALLAVGLPQGRNDYALQLPDGVFVLADATGPALLPLGRTSEEVTAQLAKGVSSYQRIP